MSLLDQLWDDTVAGPRPDSGLGKLRKYSSVGPRLQPGKGIVGELTIRGREQIVRRGSDRAGGESHAQHHDSEASRSLQQPVRFASGFSGRVNPSGIAVFWRQRVVPFSEKVNVGRLREGSRSSTPRQPFFSLRRVSSELSHYHVHAFLSKLSPMMIT